MTHTESTQFEAARVSAIGAASSDEGQRSYVDWPAIFAGTVLGSAISLLLITFGSALGLAMTSAYSGSGMSLAAFAISTALWLIWVQVSGFFAGGYLTGRLRRRLFDATEHESDIRDGSHGLIVWALGLLLGAAVTMAGLTTTISTATTAVSNVTGTAATAAMASNNGDTGNSDALMGLTVDRFLRPAASEAGSRAETTPAAPATDATARQSRADARAEVLRILAPAVVSGQIESADRSYLVDLVSRESRLSRDEAATRVDQLWTDVTAAQQKVRDAAERARKIGVLMAFITAVSLLLSAVAAYSGAVLGGNHRDKQYVIGGWTGRW